MKSRWTKLIAAVPLLALLAGCPPRPEPEPEPEVEVDEGVFADRLGQPMAKATEEQIATFERGEKVALRTFDTDDGLGPKFNVVGCTSCHEQPVAGGSSPRYRDFLLVAQKLSDGSQVSLGVNGVQPQYSTEPPHRVPTPPDANILARRNTIGFFGVGALAALPEEAIMANADPDDEDGDGISGRPNLDRGFVGRFGRKSQTVSIEGFIRGPLFNHVGLTSNPLSADFKAQLPVPSDGGEGANAAGLTCIHCQAAAPEEPNFDDDGVPDPELSEQDLFDLVSWSMLLGAPKPAEPTEQTMRGEELFTQAGCADCHVPTLEGEDGAVPVYSDLLLHDMGEELADGFQQGVATGSEFRTHPLWGIAPTGPFLHDGRADTLDEAIRLHGGEGEASRDAYEALTDDERDDVIAFLKSLGGDEMTSDGLLPPDDPVAEAGVLGGPIAELSEADAETFRRGRAVFDRDIARDEGLGSGFNGDSCRACHFQPTIGGSGHADVSVTRQGIIDPMTMTYFDPEPGTMLHKHARTINARPQADPDCNVFELRQTPPLFGLGLVDQIPDSEVLTLEDPQDDDGDGISGRAHVLDDGRVGKFGWKANIPTLEDFVRDALSNEVGLTIPDKTSFPFGFDSDEDGVADPEFGGSDYDALVFFNAQLAPPPRGEIDDEVRTGDRVFSDVGCASCHTPQLQTEDGAPVNLYSDLLLHDVHGDDFRGIEAGDAKMNEFRTPPLWGISKTAPYMHDGFSPTLDAAIRAHGGEAEGVVAAYDALDASEREALLAFLRSL